MSDSHNVRRDMMKMDIRMAAIQEQVGALVSDAFTPTQLVESVSERVSK